MEETEQTQPRRRRRWLRRTVLTLLSLVVLLVGAVVGFLLYFHIPSNAAGMAAKGVCSAAFVAGRGTDADALMEQDVLPASPVLQAISTEVDTTDHTVTAKFLGMFSRRAALVTDRGCVLDADPDPKATSYEPAASRLRPWPLGDVPGVPSESRLVPVVEKAFAGSGDPVKPNARGVAVLQHGRLLIARDGDGLAPRRALHGWSMTKTVAAMLAFKKFEEVGLDLETPVVDAFPEGREPGWVPAWSKDDRAKITIADLMFMRSGLAIDESYDPWGEVVQMLYGEDDMPAWAADHETDHKPGTYWEYLSASSNLLARVVRAQFDSDAEYWAYPRTALFGPVGVNTAALETDTDGTWVGSSYAWMTAADWARLGLLMLQDGKWQNEQVLPAGWLELAATRAVPEGEGHGYGAQTWLLGDRTGGECKDYPGVPADTLAMEGHWGQLVAMVPSRDAVVVRLGWTFDPEQFDGCQFVSDVLAALPD